MTATYSEWKQCYFFFRLIINKPQAHNILLYSRDTSIQGTLSSVARVSLNRGSTFLKF